jgi:uncharacterized membrane protein YeaQ/YmgE (transglycosylase-associated protein family)
MRRQMVCLIGILSATVAGRAAASFAVQNYGIPGGAYSFLFTAFLLSVVFMALTAWYTRVDFKKARMESGRATPE